MEEAIPGRIAHSPQLDDERTQETCPSVMMIQDWPGMGNSPSNGGDGVVALYVCQARAPKRLPRYGSDTGSAEVNRTGGTTGRVTFPASPCNQGVNCRGPRSAAQGRYEAAGNRRA